MFSSLDSEINLGSPHQSDRVARAEVMTHSSPALLALKPRRAEFSVAAATSEGGVPRKRESHTHKATSVSLWRRSVARKSPVCTSPSLSSPRVRRKCGMKSWGVTAATSHRRVASNTRSISCWSKHIYNTVSICMCIFLLFFPNFSLKLVNVYWKMC